MAAFQKDNQPKLLINLFVPALRLLGHFSNSQNLLSVFTQKSSFLQ